MNRTELERAWHAAEPSAGFADRVLDRARRGPALLEPDSRRAALSAGRGARRWRWLVLPVAALALLLGAMLLLWPARPIVGGDVFAAQPRVVAIGTRAVAELSIGAHIRWSGGSGREGSGRDGSGQKDSQPSEVEQDRGEVTYRVSPGSDFRVRTPFGSVTVLGTVFRVVVADRDASGGEPVKNSWAIAGASAALGGALVWVSVEQGRVRLAQGKDELVLGAGQSGAIGSDGIPRLASMEPGAPGSVQVAEADAERERARQVADAVRRHAARRRAAREALTPAAAEHAGSAPRIPAPTPAPAAPPLSEEQQKHRREYIQRTMRQQYFSVARACYQELLERQPSAQGRVTLEFAIVGDGDAGVVDRVATRDDETSLDDPEFLMCMRESLYTAVFEAPPPGEGETTVVYPIVLAPE